MYVVALSPDHSQILSRSRGDKIWEWPGDEAMYVALCWDMDGAWGSPHTTNEGHILPYYMCLVWINTTYSI